MVCLAGTTPSLVAMGIHKVVGLFTLKDKAGCGRGNALRVCSSVQFEKQSHERVTIFVFFMSNDPVLPLLHTFIVQVMEHEQFSTPRFIYMHNNSESVCCFMLPNHYFTEVAL